MKGTRYKVQGSRLRAEAIHSAVRLAPQTIKEVEPFYVLSRMQQF